MAFLPRFFEGLSQGSDPAAILAGFKKSDEEIESRQIGMIPYNGNALAFTGTRCSPWAGHKTGRDYACQGNILFGHQVVDAMTEAFERTEGRLYKRLHAALAAGDAAGGDLRGRQSARLAVMKKGYGQPDSDTLIDFVIEDHANPVAEVGRLVGVMETLLQILRRLGAFSRAADDEKPAILAELRALLDDKRDCRYLDWWESLAMGYHEIGDIDSAVDAFGIYLGINPALRPVLEAGVDCGTFPADLADRLFA
jgi:uncharacterized Ntn-hydrolase superfamily protein